MNALDLELYDFAKSMVARRLKLMQEILGQMKLADPPKNLQSICQKRELGPRFHKSVGIFRPPGHKGPF